MLWHLASCAFLFAADNADNIGYQGGPSGQPPDLNQVHVQVIARWNVYLSPWPARDASDLTNPPDYAGWGDGQDLAILMRKR